MTWTRLPACALLASFVGCAEPAATPGPEPATTAKETPMDAPVPPAAAAPTVPPPVPPVRPEDVTYTRVVDSVEKSFSLDLPAGWKHDAFLVRSYQLVKPVATATSPDGGTAIFVGDATMTYYTKPGQLDPFLERQAIGNPLMKLGPYVPADRFLADHLQRKFGRLEGFRMESPAPSPLSTEAMEASFQRMGRRTAFTTASIAFEFVASGRRTRGIAHCAVMDAGLVWYPDVGGVVSTGDPAAFGEVLRRVVLSNRTDPEWQRGEQAVHEQRMAQLRQDYENQQVNFRTMNQQHAARMQQITASAAAHSQRMDNLTAASDARNQQWASQQASNDAGHERFLNLIRGEHTVSDGGGHLFQVDNSHQKYFVNPTTNTYVGTDGTTSLDDLRKLGLNPDDFREARIVR